MSRRRPEPGPARPAVGSALAGAAAELEALVAAHAEIGLVAPPSMVGNALWCRLSLETGSFVPGEGGLRVDPVENLIVVVPDGYPQKRPQVLVDHQRWLGFPHVLLDGQLCIYLDPDREWLPGLGMAGALDRIWEWFDEAIGGRFDARTSLHHALGGIPPGTPGSPTMVVRRSPGELNPGIRRVALSVRNRRVDVTAWDRKAEDGELEGLAVVLPGPLPGGVGSTLSDLLSAVGRRGFPGEAMLIARMKRAVATLPEDGTLYLIVAARNPALTGVGAYDLAAAALDPATVHAVGLDQPGPALPELANEPALLYLRMDDARPEISVRRDDRRPVAWFAGKSVELWGCGALGSWTAEILVRAGVRRLVIRDSKGVGSGLLVRQNYTEGDVGAMKSRALAERLRALADGVLIEVGGHGGPDLLEDGLVDCDLLIDATVSNAASAAIDHVLLNAAEGLLVAQVATDSLSSTLGIVTLTASGRGTSTSAVDHYVRSRVFEDAALEGFRTFWDADGDVLFAPARGCSTPTFHGSAADAMAIASTAVSLLGPAADQRLTGGFLFAAPHTPIVVPARTWVEFDVGV